MVEKWRQDHTNSVYWPWMRDETPVLYLGDVPITLTQVYEVEMPENNGDTN